MPPLVLKIRISSANKIEVTEKDSPSNEHSQSCTEIVRWEADDDRIKSWVVQFVDKDGGNLRSTESPFENGETRFSGKGNQHDQGRLKACEHIDERRRKYDVSCEVYSGTNPPKLDPILVINDPYLPLKQAVTKLNEVSAQLEILTTQLGAVSEQVSSIAEDLSSFNR